MQLPDYVVYSEADVYVASQAMRAEFTRYWVSTPRQSGGIRRFFGIQNDGDLDNRVSLPPETDEDCRILVPNTAKVSLIDSVVPAFQPFTTLRDVSWMEMRVIVNRLYGVDLTKKAEIKPPKVIFNVVGSEKLLERWRKETVYPTSRDRLGRRMDARS